MQKPVSTYQHSRAQSTYQRNPLTLWNIQERHTSHYIISDANRSSVKDFGKQLEKTRGYPSKIEVETNIENLRRDESTTSMKSSAKSFSSKLQVDYLAKHINLCSMAKLCAELFGEFG